MNHPHVSTPRYCLQADGTISFDNPPAIEQKINGFSMRLADGVVTKGYEGALRNGVG